VFVGGLILQEFNCHVAKGSVSQILGDVRKVPGREEGIAIVELQGDRRLAFDIVLHLRCTEYHAYIVVSVMMHQGGSVRRNFYLESADVCVLKSEMVARLRGDFNSRWSLRKHHDRAKEEDRHEASLHARDCSSGLG